MPSLRFSLSRSVMPILKRSQARLRVDDIERLVRFRERSERLADMLMPLPRGIRLERSSVGGVAGDWLIPQDAPDDPVILFLHGGGFIFGWSNANRRIVAYIARFAGLRAFGVDYRLAPDHRYPAAHDDCFTVYRTLLQGGKQVVLIGESSGGVLALATLLRARAEGLPQPPLCALISPVVDCGFEDRRVWNADDVFAHPNFALEIHKHYVAENDTRLPDLSPVYADLSGLALLFVLGAANGLLRSEAERLAEAAKRYDLEMELVLWPHVWHGWHVFVPFLPEATQALRMLGGVVHQHCNR